MNKKKSYILSIIGGLILIVFGFVYQILNPSEGIFSLIVLNIGLVVMVVAVLKYNRLGAGVVQDEMSREISARALSYSWLLVFVVSNVLFWVDYLDVFDLKAQPLLGAIIFLMPISVAVFKKFLIKKGNENL